MDAPPLYAVIMAGGSGTRFWPASRAARPKQFLPISGGAPMIVETYRRLEGLVPRERILVVTAASQAALVREALPELAPENVLAEPQARNTAPCVALAAFEVHRRDPRAVQVVLPADHVIEPAESFRATLRAGASEAAESGCLLTFGIRPTFPATGYGYIEAGTRLGERDGVAVFEVARFVEKPSAQRAAEFLARGSFTWNAGIFVWSTAAILAALRELTPATHAGLEGVYGGTRSLEEVYPGLTAEPVDVAILERAANVRTMPIDYTWNDVGSWAALAEITAGDGSGNRAVMSGGARLIAEDSRDCLAYAEGDQLIALVGVRDLVVVHSEGATLVLPRERAQDVKRIVERLRAEGPEHL